MNKGGAALHGDVCVGPCNREQTDHLGVSLLKCDGSGGGAALHCDVPGGTCVKEQADTSRWSVHPEMR